MCGDVWQAHARYVEFPFCERGNLGEYVLGLRSNSLVSASEVADRVRQMMLQAALGVAFLHEHGIVHRDIKPENLLCCADGRVGVADFESSRAQAGAGTSASSYTMGGVAGTAGYRAPEVATGGSATPASDMFSFGGTLCVLMHGKKPEEFAQLPAPSENERDLPTTGTELDDLLRNLLQHEPSRRLVARDCILHGYFRASAIEELRGSGELQDARARLQAMRGSLEVARRDNQWQRRATAVQINRETLLEDGMKLVSKLNGDHLKGTLKITFVAAGIPEAGVDVGGLLSDFYSQLWAKIVNKYFQAGVQGGYLPKVTNANPQLVYNSFYTIGKLLAKTIYDGRATGQTFGASLFKYLQSESPSCMRTTASNPDDPCTHTPLLKSSEWCARFSLLAVRSSRPGALRP